MLFWLLLTGCHVDPLQSWFPGMCAGKATLKHGQQLLQVKLVVHAYADCGRTKLE